MSLAPLLLSFLARLRGGFVAMAGIAILSALGACQAGDAASQDNGGLMQARVHAKAELFETETGSHVLTTLPAGSVVSISEPDPEALEAALRTGARIRVHAVTGSREQDGFVAASTVTITR